MKILIAPDKFKGSLSAVEVCDVIASALREINPNIDIQSLPLADGGEGTAELLTSLSGGSLISVTVMDPLRRPIAAAYGKSADGHTAFIETASASGLQLLDPKERNPMLTTSYGTGQLIAAAMASGVSEIVLGIGGSATNDAGTGMAEALGFIFSDQHHLQLLACGQTLRFIESIDTTKANARIRQIKFTVLLDVRNPFYGKSGAAFVYSPQKGAHPRQVSLLDQGLEHLATVVKNQMNVDLQFSGAGAGGGLGGGAKLFLQAQLVAGIDYVMSFVAMEDRVLEADLVITGEGKMDDQTLEGKVVSGVARLALRHQKPCIAFTGQCTADAQHAKTMGLTGVYELVSETVTAQVSMSNAAALLRERTLEAMRPLLEKV